MTMQHDNRMERELAARERVRETLAKVDRTLAEPYVPPERRWQAPEKAVPVARVVEPPRPAKAAPVAVRAPMPAAKQGNRAWMLASFAVGEEPRWRWVKIPDDEVVVEAMARAFGDFTGAARREFDQIRDSGDASRHNLLLRLAEAERRIAQLEAKR